MINNTPLVSCIIPVHNSENTIEETINSVINQSYSNIEIIVVNDRSADSTKAIIMKIISSEIIEIRYYENPGFGACAARNHGFQKSTGEFIQFLDSDDLLSPNKIEDQVKDLSLHSKGYLASGIWGRFFKSPEDVSWENQLINKPYQNPAQWLLDSWMGNGMGLISTWLSPRKLIEESGGWNEELKINQDGEFFSRVLLNAEGLIYCPNAKVYYRSGNNQSISQQNTIGREKAESLLKSYQLYKKNASDKDMTGFLKMGLAQNFLMYMYIFHRWHKDLTFIAEQEFYDLGYKNPWPVGGPNFQKLVKIVGFKNSLLIKNKIKFN